MPLCGSKPVCVAGELDMTWNFLLQLKQTLLLKLVFRLYIDQLHNLIKDS